MKAHLFDRLLHPHRNPEGIALDRRGAGPSETAILESKLHLGVDESLAREFCLEVQPGSVIGRRRIHMRRPLTEMRDGQWLSRGPRMGKQVIVPWVELARFYQNGHGAKVRISWSPPGR